MAVDDLSLAVRAGEIVGLAGVQGNGQDELVEAIAGIRRKVSGRIAICGTAPAEADPAPRGPRAWPISRPTGRGRPVAAELDLGEYGGRPPAGYRKGPFLAAGAARRRCRELIRNFDVRGASEDTPAGSLSGGNQQKVQLARELTREVGLIIAEQPSQGVDIGAIESIHRMLVGMRDEGRAVFVVSADLDEIFSLCDRILVIYRGRIVGDFASEEADVGRVGQLMGGIGAHDAPARRDGAQHRPTSRQHRPRAWPA